MVHNGQQEKKHAGASIQVHVHGKHGGVPTNTSKMPRKLFLSQLSLLFTASKIIKWSRSLLVWLKKYREKVDIPIEKESASYRRMDTWYLHTHWKAHINFISTKCLSQICTNMLQIEEGKPCLADRLILCKQVIMYQGKHTHAFVANNMYWSRCIWGQYKSNSTVEE